MADTTDTILARLQANANDHRDTEGQVVKLALLALVSHVRDGWPDARYIDLQVSDQDDYGSLFEANACDTDRNPLPDDDCVIDEHNLGHHFHDGNRSFWLPSMVESSVRHKYRSGYVLIVDKVLAEISLDDFA